MAWRRIADERSAPDEDLYGGTLDRLRLPTLLLHGARDPRTEPGELDAIRAALGHTARFEIFPEGGHSPHSERATSDEVTRVAQRFLSDLEPGSDPVSASR